MEATKSKPRAQVASVAAFVAVIAAMTIFTSVWPSLVLALWLADLAHPVVRFFNRAMRGRRRAAAAITVLVVIAVLLPVTIALATLVGSARTLLEQVGTSFLGLSTATTTSAVPNVVIYSPPSLATVMKLVEQHGASVWAVAVRVVGASSEVVVNAVIFLVALYAFSVDGRSLFLWIARARILDTRTLGRFLQAFRETGRGLLVGMGGTALAQGVVATIAYSVLGVQNAVMFGFLTGMCATVPMVGAMLVWGPIAAALALNGHAVRAIVLVALGIGVISTIDNVLRPWLARVGHLRLPTLVVFVSMMAGLRLIGPAGILLGPIVVRLATEALALAAEARVIERRMSGAVPHVDEPASSAPFAESMSEGPTPRFVEPRSVGQAIEKA